MRTLVTGASGFLGGLILNESRRLGRVTRGLDLAPPSSPDADIEIGSVLHSETVARAMDGVECVIHAAAIAHLWAPGRSSYDRTNLEGTATILAEAERRSVRMVYVSSYTTLIDRNTRRGTVLDESVEIPPGRLCGDYPRTKREAELLVQAAAAGGLDALCILPSAPIGAPDPSNTPPTQMIADLASGRLPAIVDCTLNLVDARAVARAILAATTEGKAGERYLLSGEDIDLGDLAALIEARTGVRAPKYRAPKTLALGVARVEALVARLTGMPPRAPLTGVRLASVDCRFRAEKARATLGFKPRSVAECLNETLAAVSVAKVGAAQG